MKNFGILAANAVPEWCVVRKVGTVILADGSKIAFVDANHDVSECGVRIHFVWSKWSRSLILGNRYPVVNQRAAIASVYDFRSQLTDLHDKRVAFHTGKADGKIGWGRL